MRTLEELAAQVDCFIFGHQWTETSNGRKCRNCGEVRR